MNNFEKMWRAKIKKNTKEVVNKETSVSIGNINELDEIKYTETLIQSLKDNTLDERIKEIFCKSACHIPHTKLDNAKAVYEQTKSIEQTRQVLEDDFKVDIKQYKNLSDEQVDMIIEKGWGLAGVIKHNKIIATKIPSQFHEYFAEDDPLKKKSHYCHCPRIRHAFTEQKDLDSIYCNCGGGFYQDVWEYITGNKVELDIVKSLFEGHDVCQFEIRIKDRL